MTQVRIWKLKACPRCRGDVFICKDMDGWYEHCLQCGYETALPIALRVHHPTGDIEQNQSVDSIEHLSSV